MADQNLKTVRQLNMAMKQNHRYAKSLVRTINVQTLGKFQNNCCLMIFKIVYKIGYRIKIVLKVILFDLSIGRLYTIGHEK